MKSKNVRVIIFVIAIIAIISVPGIFSYLTDAEAVSNIFVVGEVKIDLQEPKWKDSIDSNNNGKVKNEGSPTDTQLFTYDVNNDWKEIVSARKDNLNDSNEIESYTYVYYYNKELRTNETTRNFV